MLNGRLEDTNTNTVEIDPGRPHLARLIEELAMLS